jgi:hypothetical protein
VPWEDSRSPSSGISGFFYGFMQLCTKGSQIILKILSPQSLHLENGSLNHQLNYLLENSFYFICYVLLFVTQSYYVAQASPDLTV